MPDRPGLHPDPHAPVVVVGVSATRSVHDRRVDLVADALRCQGRRVHEVQVGVPAQGPQAWVTAVVERLSESLAARGPVDSVHAFGWRAAVGLAALRDELSGALVAHLADGPSPGAPDEATVTERLAWAAARSADAVVLDSQWAVEKAVRAGVPRYRIVRGLPVTSLPEADPDPQSSHPTAAGGRRLRLLAVGGIGRSAGTDLLLRALRRVPDVDLVVAAPAGASTSQLSKARSWLEQQLAGPDEGRRIEVAPFSARLLRDCDAVVDAGTTAGSCDGVVTAMAHRRAVLASDLGPRAEAVVDGTTGAVVRPGDWRAWCSQIAALMHDPFKLEAYGDAGLERSRAGFAPSRRAELITRLDTELGVDQLGVDQLGAPQTRTAGVEAS